MSQETSAKAAMPKVGLGLWKIAQEDCAQAVYDAISIGYRHLDSACDYGNEKQVGEGIKRAIDDGLCSREDLWITSKLWNTYHAKEHVKPALEKDPGRFRFGISGFIFNPFPPCSNLCAF